MFTVPQFIDTEDKIIGALTVRQFIISLVGFLSMALAYKIFSFVGFVVYSIFAFVVFGTLAFVKINGRPFHYFLLNLVQTNKKAKLRVWNHRNPMKDVAEQDDDGEALTPNMTPGSFAQNNKDLLSSRLNELSLIVDTKGVYKGEEENIRTSIIKE